MVNGRPCNHPHTQRQIRLRAKENPARYARWPMDADKIHALGNFLFQARDAPRAGSAASSINLNSTHKNFWSHAEHREIERYSKRGPLQELGNTIDLIVMSTIRESQKFMQERVEPVG